MQKIKGSALAYSLIILAVMLFIVGSISFVSITEKKDASSTDFSTQAYQTADSGFQIALRAISSNSGNDLNYLAGKISATATCTNDASGNAVIKDVSGAGPINALYTLSFGTSGDKSCAAIAGTVTSIKSIGTYKNTARSVEVSIVKNCNIHTCQDLQDMQDDLSGNYILCNDIDCSATSTWNGGSGFIPVGTNFKGVLDGNGYAIKDLYISGTTNNVGLFKTINNSNTVSIKNVTLKNPNIQSTSTNVGGLVGSIFASTGSVISNSAVYGGTIKSSSFAVGGLVGGITASSGSAAVIDKSTVNNATITSGSNTVGGLVGSVSNCPGLVISNSAANDVTVSGSYGVGGLTGSISASGPTLAISNSAVYGGTFSATSYGVGGLAGSIFSSGTTISNSIVGDITISTVGSNKGALSGITTLISASPIVLYQSYWESGIASAACGTSSRCTGDTSKTKTQLKTATPFTGWDTTIWKFQSGSYPCLIGVMSGC